MLLIYALLFCRVAIGLVFTISAWSKARNMAAFARTIVSFDLLPARFVAIAAPAFLVGECMVALLMLIGGPMLWFGFALAAALLLGFSVGLWSVVSRNLRTTCGCFGPSEKLVSSIDLWRNAGFILCALGGCGAFAAAREGPAAVGLAEWSLLGLAAAVFVTVLIQLGEIAQVLGQNP